MQNKLVEKLLYRPEIDGLRAIAVLAVVFFHADLGCPGGFVGVDLFFVISGFLITSLIWTDLEDGKFSFSRFWEKRARRIAPAAIVMVLVILLLGWYLLLPSDYEALATASIAQALFSANVHYWLETGYFATAATERPLLHTWSLSVEEQYYLLVPMLLWLLHKTIGSRKRLVIVSILVTAFLVSLVASIYGVAKSPSATFYLLPTRAWELLTGSIIAFIPRRGWLLDRASQRISECMCWVSILLMTAPIFIYSTATPFPGAAALCPCLGAALFIVFSGSESARGTFAVRMLSAGPVVAIGLLSYSLYLWHWPLFAFAHYRSIETPSLRTRVTLVVLSLFCAWLSLKYVEQPFRLRKFARTRSAMFGIAGLGLMSAVVAGIVIKSTNGFQYRFPTQIAQYANADRDWIHVRNLDTSDVVSGKLSPLGRPDEKRVSLLVWGDSHAQAVLPAVESLLLESGLCGEAATYQSTAPVLNWWSAAGWGMQENEALKFNQAVAEHIQRLRIPHVMMVASWGSYSASEEFDEALVNTVRSLVNSGTQPWLVMDVPVHAYSVPKVLSRAALSGQDHTLFCKRLQSTDEFDGISFETIARVEAVGGIVINPKPEFLSLSKEYYVMESGGVALYKDGGHLSTSGATRKLLPFLRRNLGESLTNSAAK